MLRGGFANKIMDKEVAYIGATTGGLSEALEGYVDGELLDWAGRPRTCPTVPMPPLPVTPT